MLNRRVVMQSLVGMMLWLAGLACVSQPGPGIVVPPTLVGGGFSGTAPPVATVMPVAGGGEVTPEPTIDFPVYDGSDGRPTLLVRRLAFDTPQVAGLGASDYAHNWLLSLEQGQTVQLDAAGLDGADPVITLIDPNGVYVQQVDDTFGLDARLVFSAEASGVYTVRIWLYGAGNYEISATAGTPESFGLEIDPDLPLYTNSDSDTTYIVQRIDFGVEERGEFPGDDIAHNWLFEGVAGQTVTVRVTGSSGTDATLTIIDPNGLYVNSVDDVIGLDPELTVTLTMDGLYTARVGAYGSGQYVIVVAGE